MWITHRTNVRKTRILLVSGIYTDPAIRGSAPTPAIRVTSTTIRVQGPHEARRRRQRRRPRCALSSTRAVLCIKHTRANHAHCTLCTQCHTRHWQATAPRHPISARLQQQHIAEQGDPSLIESAKPLSGTTRKDSAARKAKKAATDRSAAKKKDASHLEERDANLAKTKKKKKKNSATRRRSRQRSRRRTTMW